MRNVFIFARLFCRQNRISTRYLRHSHVLNRLERVQYTRFSSFFTGVKSNRRHPSGPVLFALLTPAAFVQISEEDGDNGETVEERMLEASRAEIEKTMPDDIHGFRKFFRRIYLWADAYIIEPIATGFRFLHLVVIFVPLIISIPAIWVGPRLKERNNDRRGTIWWYEFLVSSMERAGPAFIKVVPPHCR